MIVNVVIVSIIVFCFILAIIDKFFVNEKMGLWPEFMKGISAIGELVLAITGILVLIPLLTSAISTSTIVGFEISMLVSIFIPIDMGGYQLAEAISSSQEMASLSATIYGSMMGATVLYSIPLASTLIKDKNKLALTLRGFGIGMVMIPAGTFIGGLCIGIEIVTLLYNLIIPLVISIILLIAIIFAPNATAKIFIVLSYGIKAIAYIGLIIGVINEMILVNITDMSSIWFFANLGSIYDGFGIAGIIGITLAGAYPLSYLIIKLCKKPLHKLEKYTSINETGLACMLLTCVDNIAFLSQADNMNNRDIVINSTWSIGMSWIIGGHLAFIASNDPVCLWQAIASKIVVGVLSLLLLYVLSKITNGKIYEIRHSNNESQEVSIK